MGSVKNLLDANNAGGGLLGMIKLLPLMNSIMAIDAISSSPSA
ncbi:hypothetical protein [Speluncibacter jeojiensis]|uniref:Uncharacterized protein n=1 Tax=Speluncibacter jeojiensis TaxID=2710754 RepID=A0A9X4M3U0_9ACTN|nr:hypothetical protein [Corynebacteriales bacterium D3-21]